ERGIASKSGKLDHQTHIRNRAHLGDECVVLRHVTGHIANLADIVADVVPEDARRARGGLMKTEQHVNERRFPGAVRPEQTNGAGAERTPQIVEDAPSAQVYCQTVEFDNRCHCMGRIRRVFSSTLGIWNGPPDPASASRFMPKKLPVEATSIRSGCP